MENSPRSVARERVAGWCDQHFHLPSAKAYHAASTQEAQDKIGDAIAVIMWGLVGPHCQTGPSPEVCAHLILGKTPRELSKNKLTKREAHTWVTQSEHATPKEWLWAQVVKRHAELSDSSPRSIAVMRWVDNVMSNPERKASALRVREGVIAGHHVAGRPIDRLDEVSAVDLTASPVDTIENAARRIAKDAWDGPDELTPAHRWESKLPAGVVVLRSYSTLMREGAELRHCAVVYATAVSRRECIILSLCTKEGARSTAEITDGGAALRVAQHKGPRNETPHPSCVALLEQALKCMV